MACFAKKLFPLTILLYFLFLFNLTYQIIAVQINYPDASGRGIKREKIGDFHAISDISSLACFFT